MPLLEVKGLTKRFGGLVALNDVNLTINEGETHGIIGPNGAGKTTLFNVITGEYKPTTGTVTEIEEILKVIKERRAVQGECYVCKQSISDDLFNELTNFLLND